MARSIIAVIVSYIAMFVLIFLAFTAEYMLLGPNHAFRTGSFEASHRWIAIAFAINFVVAIIGGFMCAAIAKGGTVSTGDRRLCAWALAGDSLGDGRKAECSSAWRRHSHVRGDAKSKGAALGAVYFSDNWSYWSASGRKVKKASLNRTKSRRDVGVPRGMPAGIKSKRRASARPYNS